MTNLPEAPYSITVKVGNDLLTIRAATQDEFIAHLLPFGWHPTVSQVITATVGGAPAAPAAAPAAPTVEQAVAAVTSTLGGTVAAPQSAVEVVEGKYGDRFTYGHPDAPDLPDGRGKYIFREWKSKDGKHRKAWVDPTVGPRPAKPGAEEAKIVWA